MARTSRVPARNDVALPITSSAATRIARRSHMFAMVTSSFSVEIASHRRLLFAGMNDCGDNSGRGELKFRSSREFPARDISRRGELRMPLHARNVSMQRWPLPTYGSQPSPKNSALTKILIFLALPLRWRSTLCGRRGRGRLRQPNLRSPSVHLRKRPVHTSIVRMRLGQRLWRWQR